MKPSSKMNVEENQPSTSRGRNDANDNPDKSKNPQPENHFLRRRANRNRLIQAERQRERQHRLQHAQLNARRMRRNLPPLADPYDSAESGCWSIKDRRPKTKNQLYWDQIHKQDLEMQEKEELARKQEEEEELDALFFYMTHGHDDDSTGRKVKFPPFLDIEAMDREFKEQLENEAEKTKLREAEEERLKEKKIIAKYLREQEEKRRAKLRAKGIEVPEVIEIGSSDEEESRITQRAIQWTGYWIENGRNNTSGKCIITRPLVTINNPEMMNKCSLPRFNVMCPVHVEESDSE
ncbi:capping protein inhibiting regulator of actin dynamics-like isoform X2 [Episyrphus balteatus]|uniref:capping protein inhibiting regulator of actin dynamics-like isoform X2 n=1 Tax=Episyrphus balteatus TaxID=286459 RepID=UPI002485EF70|nr:capping protein inhibiting regulator of actin dynamics-like isoform X2 [Episyrphus balteatus]